MHRIVIKLAEINISISMLYPQTLSQFKEFETNEQSQYEICMSKQRLEKERILLKDRFPFSNFSDVFLERNAIYRDIPHVLIKEDVVMLHGVLVRYENNGYLFTAPSGTGKSTHANLWIKSFPTCASIINGDKVLLKQTKDEIIAYGSPWKGKENIGNNQCVKLKNICYIQRNSDNKIEKIGWNSKSITWLLEQSSFYGLENTLRYRMKWFIEASKKVSIFELKCNMNPDSAIVALNGMKIE